MKEQPGLGISVGGVQLPAALAAAGLIDKYTFVVHPVVAARARPARWHPGSVRLELVARR